ncbi:MAG: hypothetical protein ABIO38_02300 [Luteimonas sp.]
MRPNHRLIGCLAIILALLASACGRNLIRDDIAGWSGARQLVVVTTPDWEATSGTLRRYARDGSGWTQVGTAAPVVIGRSGSAWGLGLHPTQTAGPMKREGDGRAPAGVFRIGDAFGYAASVDTALSYLPMQATHYCMDVPASPLYNRIVDSRVVGESAVQGSTEPMRLDVHAKGSQQYKLGMVIEHNQQAIAGAGSCIFAHLWKTPETTTAGCTAMDEPVMRELLAWLRADARPVFVLMPQAEYRRLQAEWSLPANAGL